MNDPDPTTAGPTDDTRNLDGGDETRRELRQPTSPTVQRPSEQTTAGDQQGTLEDRIRRRLEATDGDDGRSRTDPLIGRDIVGRFTIYKKIGAGGMGAVYRAKQKGMDRDVAIKVLLRELTENETVLRRFHIEALAVSKLRHPNTIQIFDFGETDDGLLYIAMEYLEGRPLQKVLSEERQLSVRRALNVALQMARSLREAHSKGIVHRDLKPDNVILETVGEESDFVKVLDFGVAKLADGDGQQKTLTKAGSIFGTPKYMSPEQSRGGEIDARSDIYAIGVLLYEMLIGKAPFDAESPLGILIKHIQEQPPLFQEMRPDIVVPEPVETFVLKLLEKDTERRPQTAEAVIRELEGLIEGLPEIFRNVVTRADAEAAGIEITTSSRTVADTQLGPMTQTVGAQQDKTMLATPGTRRRRWPLVVIAALIMVLAGGGGILASLDRLPASYTDFTALGDVEVGTVPEFNLKDVFVNIVSEPLGADVIDDEGEKVGTTPLLLRRNQNASSEAYTFRREGFMDYNRSFSFEDDATITIQLVAVEVPKPERVPVARPDPTPDRPVTTPGTRPDPRPPTAAKPDPTPPPAEFNPTRVRDIKTNPFGTPSQPGGTQANPYGD